MNIAICRKSDVPIADCRMYIIQNCFKISPDEEAENVKPVSNTPFQDKLKIGHGKLWYGLLHVVTTIMNTVKK